MWGCVSCRTPSWCKLRRPEKWRRKEFRRNANRWEVRLEHGMNLDLRRREWIRSPLVHGSPLAIPLSPFREKSEFTSPFQCCILLMPEKQYQRHLAAFLPTCRHFWSRLFFVLSWLGGFGFVTETIVERTKVRLDENLQNLISLTRRKNAAGARSEMDTNCNQWKWGGNDKDALALVKPKRNHNKASVLIGVGGIFLCLIVQDPVKNS